MPETAYATITNLFRGEPVHTVVRFALLGGASGAIATTIIYAFDWADLRWDAEFSIESVGLVFNPLTLVPGLVFGLVIGLALWRRGLAGPRTYAAYVAASTVSYYAAYTLAVEVLAEIVSGSLVIGMLAGLFGSACLTGLSALMFAFLRRLTPCLLMLFAGCVLGGLLVVPLDGPDTFLSWVIFFASWQAGYAASLAVALPQSGPGQLEG